MPQKAQVSCWNYDFRFRAKADRTIKKCPNCRTQVNIFVNAV